MNIKKTAKKIVAVGSGVALAGATFMGALAAAPDLSQYPSQFIDDGQFDGKIVVGANAASQDIIGAIDIAASLQAASTEDVAVGDSTTTVDLEGDVKQIKESGDMLELGESINSVTETLADGDLEMLSSGRISTQKGSTDYTQILQLGSASARLHENHDDEVGTFLKFDENQNLFTYELEFTSGLESDVDSNDVLDDIEDEVIPFLGQMYTVVKAKATNSEKGIELDLIAGDVSDTLEQGQTRTYTVDGEDYEVTVLVVGSNSQVKFLVNGEVTKSMTTGDTRTVSGIEIGVREVIQSSRAFEGDQGSIVEFYLGANTITLTDSDISDNAKGDIEVDNEDINDATLTIRGTPGASTYRINSIEYSLKLDSAYKSDSYLAAGEGIREKLDEPEGMINAMWDIVYMGTSEPSTELIEFDALGDDEYEFTFTNRRGDEFTVPYAYSTSSARGFGDEDDAFVFWEAYSETNGTIDSSTFHIGMDDYFLVTDNDDDDNGDSYVLQWDDVNEDDTTITFSNVGSGDSFDVSYSTLYDLNNVSSGASSSGQIRLGGKDFSFWLTSDGASTPTYNLAVDLDNNKSLSNNDFVNVVTKNGAIITLSDATTFTDGGNWTATLKTLGDNIDTGNTDVTSTIQFFHRASDDEFSSVDVTTDFGPVDDPNDDDREYSQSKYGTWFDLQGDDNGADDLSISYPSGQVEALVYVVGGDVSTRTSTSGQTAQRLNVLPVGIAVLDSEVSTDDDNLIVVGGPCANTIAADLLGNPSDCTEGFQAGMGMIRSFDTGDNVAILVAGFSARDTVESSRVLARAATEDVSNFSGDSVEVVIAGENDVSVRAAMDDEE